MDDKNNIFQELGCERGGFLCCPLSLEKPRVTESQIVGICYNQVTQNSISGCLKIRIKKRSQYFSPGLYTKHTIHFKV